MTARRSNKLNVVYCSECSLTCSRGVVDTTLLSLCTCACCPVADKTSPVSTHADQIHDELKQCVNNSKVESAPCSVVLDYVFEDLSRLNISLPHRYRSVKEFLNSLYLEGKLRSARNRPSLLSDNDQTDSDLDHFVRTPKRAWSISSSEPPTSPRVRPGIRVNGPNRFSNLRGLKRRIIAPVRYNPRVEKYRSASLKRSTDVRRKINSGQDSILNCLKSCVVVVKRLKRESIKMELDNLLTRRALSPNCHEFDNVFGQSKTSGRHTKSKAKNTSAEVAPKANNSKQNASKHVTKKESDVSSNRGGSSNMNNNNKKSVEAKKRKLSISVVDEENKENNETNAKKVKKTATAKSSLDVMVFKDSSNATANNQKNNILVKLLKNSTTLLTDADSSNIAQAGTVKAVGPEHQIPAVKEQVVKKNEKKNNSKTSSSQQKKQQNATKKSSTSTKHPNSMDNKQMPKEQQEAEKLMKEPKWRENTIVDTNADDEASVAAAFHLPPFFEPSHQTALENYTDPAALTLQSMPVYVWPPPDRSVTHPPQPGVSSLRNGFVRSWGRTLPIQLIDVSEHPILSKIPLSAFD